ncbi:MAG: hypothetical protein AAGI52_11990 [Bacteroidota bacterium]
MYRIPTLLALAFALTLTACDSGAEGNEQELITEVTVTLANTTNASDTITIVASDSDGDGAGITFSPARVTLTPGATYTGSVELRDTINGEDITEEIEEEAEEHLFSYSVSPSTAGAVTITDTESDYVMGDENGGDFLVGLDFQFTVAGGASGNGTLNAILYHFDDEPKTGSAVTSDEIDIDIDFPVEFATVTTAN